MKRANKVVYFAKTPCVFNDFVVELVKFAGYTLLDWTTLRMFVRPATSFVRIEDLLRLDKQKVAGLFYPKKIVNTYFFERKGRDLEASKCPQQTN